MSVGRGRVAIRVQNCATSGKVRRCATESAVPRVIYGPRRHGENDGSFRRRRFQCCTYGRRNSNGLQSAGWFAVCYDFFTRIRESRFRNDSRSRVIISPRATDNAFTDFEDQWATAVNAGALSRLLGDVAAELAVRWEVVGAGRQTRRASERVGNSRARRQRCRAGQSETFVWRVTSWEFATLPSGGASRKCFGTSEVDDSLAASVTTDFSNRFSKLQVNCKTKIAKLISKQLVRFFFYLLIQLVNVCVNISIAKYSLNSRERQTESKVRMGLNQKKKILNERSLFFGLNVNILQILGGISWLWRGSWSPKPHPI